MFEDTLYQAIDTIASQGGLQEAVSQADNLGVSDRTGLIIAIMGLLVFAAHLFTEIFSRKRIPDVLMLMAIGLVIGPILHWVSPDALGGVAKVFTTVTLVIILFESGTKLHFNTLINSIKGTMKLTTINFFVTMGIVAVIAMVFERFDLSTSLMLGAILGGTSSAVVIPLVGHLKISEKGSTILILESAFSDVLCIVFAWAFLKAIQSGSMHVGQVIGNILSSFILSSVIGFIASIIWSYLLEKIRHIKNSILTTPAFVFIVYGINQWFGFSGAIAALAFGIGMANIDTIYDKGFIVKRIFKSAPALLNDTERQLFSEPAQDLFLRLYWHLYPFGEPMVDLPWIAHHGGTFRRAHTRRQAIGPSGEGRIPCGRQDVHVGHCPQGAGSGGVGHHPHSAGHCRRGDHPEHRLRRDPFQHHLHLHLGTRDGTQQCHQQILSEAIP